MTPTILNPAWSVRDVEQMTRIEICDCLRARFGVEATIFNDTHELSQYLKFRILEEARHDS